MDDAPEEPAAARAPRRRRRLLRLLARALLVFVGAVLLYGLAALVLGAIPVNADYRPPAEGVEIFVRTNGVHADFVLPLRTPARDLHELVRLPEERRFGVPPTHVQLGWGDREFYLETPTWADLEVSTALRAVLLPSAAVMHVVYHWWPPVESDRCKKLVVRPEEYRRLCAYIERSFARDARGRLQRVPGIHHYPTDEFYEAVGSYHLFFTCNDWTNRGLEVAGIRAAVWAPFDVAIFYQLGGL